MDAELFLALLKDAPLMLAATVYLTLQIRAVRREVRRIQAHLGLPLVEEPEPLVQLDDATMRPSSLGSGKLRRRARVRPPGTPEHRDHEPTPIEPLG